jgi:hypothetical protein
VGAVRDEQTTAQNPSVTADRSAKGKNTGQQYINRSYLVDVKYTFGDSAVAKQWRPRGAQHMQVGCVVHQCCDKRACRFRRITTVQNSKHPTRSQHNVQLLIGSYTHSQRCCQRCAKRLGAGAGKTAQKHNAIRKHTAIVQIARRAHGHT